MGDRRYAFETLSERTLSAGNLLEPPWPSSLSESDDESESSLSIAFASLALILGLSRACSENRNQHHNRRGGRPAHARLDSPVRAQV